MLLDAKAVNANTYEKTKGILLAIYGDTKRITQAHLEFIEDLSPAKSATLDEMNTTFIECHRRVQALRSWGRY